MAPRPTAAELGLGLSQDLPDAQRVSLDNFQIGPWNRWAFQHISDLVTSAQIDRGEGAPSPLSPHLQDLDGIAFLTTTGESSTFGEMIDATFTDGIVVLHHGALVYERYFNGMTPATKHLLMSVSKTLTALVAGALVDLGQLDRRALVTSYVPELARSAFGDATVQQVLDMQVAVVFSEDYEDPASEVQMQDRVAGWRRRRPDDPISGFQLLSSLAKAGEHGQVFQYCSATTDVLGWILERASGTDFADLMSQLLWRKLGVEHDAYITVDAEHAPFTNGGICVTVRDLARVGQMVLQNGSFNGEQIVPAEWIDDCRFGGDNAVWLRSDTPRNQLFPRGSYRNKWWVTGDDHGAFYGTGIHGQRLWIDPTAKVVIANCSSFPSPLQGALFADSISAFTAVARHLSSGEPTTSP